MHKLKWKGLLSIGTLHKFIELLSQCGNCKNFLSNILKKIRETNIFTKEVTKNLISRNIFPVRENFLFFHTVQLLLTLSLIFHPNLAPSRIEP